MQKQNGIFEKETAKRCGKKEQVDQLHERMHVQSSTQWSVESLWTHREQWIAERASEWWESRKHDRSMGFTGNFSAICELAKILGIIFAFSMHIHTYASCVGLSSRQQHQILKSHTAHSLPHASFFCCSTYTHHPMECCASVHLSGVCARTIYYAEYEENSFIVFIYSFCGQALISDSHSFCLSLPMLI